jgi:tetratricopeptide (TPR) repeat protein
MAEACEHLGCSESETRYLKNAIDGNPKDVDVCRHCAKSLARMGQYDQAIACWARVAEIKRNDPEAEKMIGDLQIEKTKWKFGLLTQADKKSRPVAAPQKKPERGKEQTDEITIKHTAPTPPSLELEETKPYEEPKKREVQLTPAQRLERAIADDPGSVENYLQLADVYAEEGKLPDAERTLQRGLAASGSDLRIRERLEEVQVLRAKQQLKIAEKRAQVEETETAKELVKQLKENLNRIELDLYNRRAERYPQEAKWKYELGVRLKRAANYSEAIKRLGEIDPQSDRAAAAQLETGECLQYLKQYPRALAAYREASELAAKAGDSEHLKLALYRGGVLGVAMHDSAGRELLTRLVDLDPKFRDAKQRLAKLEGSRA